MKLTFNDQPLAHLAHLDLGSPDFIHRGPQSCWFGLEDASSTALFCTHAKKKCLLLCTLQKLRRKGHWVVVEATVLFFPALPNPSPGLHECAEGKGSRFNVSPLLLPAGEGLWRGGVPKFVSSLQGVHRLKKHLAFISVATPSLKSHPRVHPPHFLAFIPVAYSKISPIQP